MRARWRRTVSQRSCSLLAAALVLHYAQSVRAGSHGINHAEASSARKRTDAWTSSVNSQKQDSGSSTPAGKSKTQAGKGKGKGKSTQADAMRKCIRAIDWVLRSGINEHPER